MIALDTSAVRIGARASDKIDAIRQVGQVLVYAGNIESMLARETVANTFLGNGIAIPNGVPKDRGLIRKTGWRCCRSRTGFEWNPGELVHLVVGIADKPDEHLEILTNLTNLTNVLGDVAEAARLAKATDRGGTSPSGCPPDVWRSRRPRSPSCRKTCRIIRAHADFLEDPELAGAACDLMHNDYADQQRTQGKGTPSYETPLGRGYRVRLSKFAYIQPDIQW